MLASKATLAVRMPIGKAPDSFSECKTDNCSSTRGENLFASSFPHLCIIGNFEIVVPKDIEVVLILHKIGAVLIKGLSLPPH